VRSQRRDRAEPLLRWRTDPPTSAPAPVVCLDIDGVLADVTHRDHLVAPGGPKRWGEFFARAGDDAVVPAWRAFAAVVDPATVLALTTARPAALAEVTLTWLAQHEVRWDLLVMRAEEDFRPAPDVKADQVAALRRLGYLPVLGVDDDPRVVARYAELGIPCVGVARPRPAADSGGSAAAR
jgi:hypothetical protein